MSPDKNRFKVVWLQRPWLGHETPDNNFFYSLPLNFNSHLKFLSLGSKSIHIFLSCFEMRLNLLYFSVLNLTGAALFRSRIQMEVTILLNLC